MRTLTSSDCLCVTNTLIHCFQLIRRRMIKVRFSVCGYELMKHINRSQTFSFGKVTVLIVLHEVHEFVHVCEH